MKKNKYVQEVQSEHISELCSQRQEIAPKKAAHTVKELEQKKISVSELEVTAFVSSCDFMKKTQRI